MKRYVGLERWKYLFNDWSIFPKWTIRRIAFVGILIAISVVIFTVFASFIPLITIPSYKISFIGLPIKISGFIFGPLVGAIVGLISDIISFSIFPTFYNVYYTLAAVVNGVVSGVVGLLFVKFFKYVFGGQFIESIYVSKIYYLNKKLIKIKSNNPESKKIKQLQNRIIQLGEKRKMNSMMNSPKHLLNINLITSIILLSTICLAIFIIVMYKVDDQIIKNKSIIPNKIALIATMESGYLLMILFLIIARFKIRPKRFLVIVPIVVFSAFIESINVPILSLADSKIASGSSESIITFMFQHIVLSPVKIWANMFIIYFTYSIIAPLVNKNNEIVYN
ncbi:Folate ECF transporter S component FolT [Mycoplasmopsis maculosa]|uniref:Folate ECF transporter S component FolT n=1 Tax=Mycoplasmopsis maculosa TaxID=114885 RepID=A0A449B4M5_9BACT|nr:ECF transporter S component [Mycoplasmopsis maculosa]VEU75540.1 Folate ECF transporter S component FolT [Mycoplasmopsis maculosa]